MGLELSYMAGRLVLDAWPGPVLLVHLHNMLLKVGYLELPAGLWASLQNNSQHAFFRVGLQRDPHVAHIPADLRRRRLQPAYEAHVAHSPRLA